EAMAAARREPGDPEALERPRGDLPRLGGAAPEVARPEGDVLDHRRAEELIVRVLEEEAHARAHAPEVALAAARLAERQALARARHEQADREVQQRRLARAVAAPERDALPGPQLERGAAQDRPRRLVGEVQLAQLEQRLAHQRSRPTSRSRPAQSAPD